MEESDADAMMPERVILFDGICNFCSFWVRFILRRDPDKRFQFATLHHSKTGESILRELGLRGGEADTMIFVEGRETYVRSSAALRIAQAMRWPWRTAFVLIVIPPPVRDAFYKMIAKNRYRWFGRRATCFIPRPGDADRFLL